MGGVELVEEHKAIFLGRNTVFIAAVKVEGQTALFRVPNKWFPFISSFRPVLSNVRKEMEQNYEERNLINLDSGRTEEKVRVYHFDVDTFERYYADANPAVRRLINSLTQERDILFQMTKEAERYAKGMTSKDQFVESFKEQYEFYVNNIKPGYLFNAQNDGKDKKRG